MLYVCPTPIGNLDDITLRVLETLKSAEMIFCEDTRHSLKLLNHFEIKNKLVSLHEHNEKERVEYIVELVKEGRNIALISDAGMPGISDPGAIILKNLQSQNLPYTILPGPSASIVAAVGSTLASEGFTFVGFLPRKQKEKIEELNKYKNNPKALIIYESPHRLKDTLKDLAKVVGFERKVAVVRELTKKFEEYYVNTLEEAIDHWEDRDIKGEIIIIVESLMEVTEGQDNDCSQEDFYKLCLSENLKTKTIAKLANKIYKTPKNQVYDILLKLSE